jgi:hypothetical protein
MKLTDEIIHAIGNTDEKMLEESELYHAKKSIFQLKWLLTLSLTAACCIFFLHVSSVRVGKNTQTDYAMEDKSAEYSKGSGTAEQESNAVPEPLPEETDMIPMRFVQIQVMDKGGRPLEGEELQEEYLALQEDGYTMYFIQYGTDDITAVFLTDTDSIETERYPSYTITELYDEDGNCLSPDTEGLKIWEEKDEIQ